MLLELVLGIVLAGITILLIQVLPDKFHHKFYAIGLIIAALIYLGFSFLSQNNLWILTEIAGVIVFCIIALAGLNFSPWFLALGWLIHPAWDLLIDNHSLAVFVPRWYPTVCIGYDILMALYIAGKCIKKQENIASLN